MPLVKIAAPLTHESEMDDLVILTLRFDSSSIGAYISDSESTQVLVLLGG